MPCTMHGIKHKQLKNKIFPQKQKQLYKLREKTNTNLNFDIFFLLET